jgi:hypothetical protein
MSGSFFGAKVALFNCATKSAGSVNRKPMPLATSVSARASGTCPWSSDAAMDAVGN